METEITTFSASGDTSADVAQPSATPHKATWQNVEEERAVVVVRQAQSATMSMTIRIGRKDGAASSGLTTSAISGTPISAKAPPSPPLERPTSVTAGTAAAKKARLGKVMPNMEQSWLIVKPLRSIGFWMNDEPGFPYAVLRAMFVMPLLHNARWDYR